MPVIPEALPLTVMALVLSRGLEDHDAGVGPGGRRGQVVRAVAAQRDAAVGPARRVGYLLPALTIVTPEPVTLALPETEKPPPSMM